MIQNAHLKASPINKLFTDRHSIVEDKDYDQDSDQHRENQNPSSFMKRFKYNQQSLRNKFKNYVDKQKYIFPHAYRKLNASNFTEPNQESDIRKVRKEKSNLIEQMNRSQNQTLYYQHRNRQFAKACEILENKWRKVQNIRRERKIEVKNLEKSLNAIKQQIKSQKLSFMKKITSSKVNLTKSRLECNLRKLSQANDMRTAKQLYRSKISEEKLQVYKEKKLKCKTVRVNESNVTFYVDRVKQEKQEMAQDLRLSKLFRELAQRQEVKIDSNKVKKRSKKQIELFKNNTLSLEEKIKEFRKSLAERRLKPISKKILNTYHKNRSFTESNQFQSSDLFEANQFSTQQSPSDEY